MYVMKRKGRTVVSFSSLSYVAKETFLSLKRNGWMSLASVLTVAISLIILGFAVTMVYNTNKVAGNIESNIDISAFIQKDQTPQQVQVIQNEVAKMADVKSVVLVPKAVALQQFQSSLNSQVLSDLGGQNPLPDKLTIKATKPEVVPALASKIGAVKGVDKVNYGQGVVERIIKFTHWARWVGFSAIVLLSLASIVLISITIRLTVFARRREIQIMKFVGATDWFIRWPFLMEGLILGLAGAIIGGAVVVYGYVNLVAYFQANLSFIPLINNGGFTLTLSLVLLLAGSCIGAIGSMVSLRRFLKV